MTVLEFPCCYPLRIIGITDKDLPSRVSFIIQQHAPAFTSSSLEIRKSRNSRFMSVRVSLQAQSASQVESICEDLLADRLVKLVIWNDFVFGCEYPLSRPYSLFCNFWRNEKFHQITYCRHDRWDMVYRTSSGFYTGHRGKGGAHLGARRDTDSSKG